MPVIIDGTNGITQAGEFNSDSSFGFKNRIIDGGFTINQRSYVSGTSLSSGSYGHDRWKGGASGGTYTFTQASAGVNTTITITAGSIIQVIEGANLPEGGTYVLSWTGTAQGKIGAGSFGASGITGTITAGTNTNIEFNTGTCGNVQLEVGSTATSFDYRSYGTEFSLCERYFQKYSGNTTGNLSDGGFVAAPIFQATESYTGLTFPQMRTGPSFSYSSLSHFTILSDGVARGTLTNLVSNGSSNNRIEIYLTWSGNLTAGFSAWLRISTTNGFYSLSAEL
jgi:hypothetical protein